MDSCIQILHEQGTKLTGMWKLRKFLPVWLSLSRTESVMACPDSEVPAALKVMGTWCLAAMGMILATSSSLWTLTTILGLSR